MKTIEQHLQDLPEPYRSEALANMWWEDKYCRCKLQSKALRMAFNWTLSNEGTSYWHQVWTLILEQEKEVAN